MFFFCATVWKTLTIFARCQVPLGPHDETAFKQETTTAEMLLNFHTHHATPEGVYAPRAFGIHPWEAENAMPPADAACWCMAELIGECGLDRLRGPAIEKQEACFEAQLAIAEELGKPVVVHCVHALDLLLRHRRRHHSTPWVMHGFAGSEEQARQLSAQGIGVSIGAALLDPRRTKLRQSVKALGAGHFFLETDDDASLDIRHLYAAAAEILDVGVGQLEAEINSAYRRLLQKREVE